MIPGYSRLFGGQLLGQGLVASAAGETEKAVRSLHMVFLTEGQPEEPVEWEATVIRQGRSFSTVSVDAWQAGRRLAVGVVSLHAAEHGFSHAAPAPAVAPPAELRAIPPTGAVPCEMRVDGDVRLDAGEVGPASLAVWMRPPRGVAGGAAWRAEALLAYCSDATMMVAALRPHGAAIGSPALAATAVTSHTVSFHRPFAFDDWMLFAQESPAAAGGRAYVRGDWFDPGGLLVASCAQEVLVRPAPAGAGAV